MVVLYGIFQNVSFPFSSFSAVYDFFQGTFSMSEFADFKNIYMSNVYMSKKMHKNR